ncbi:ATP-binding protein [Paenibacillus polysaccharolyticus]|uniref:AVAST type 4 anti-phage nuclease Avs4 n=1 Tax=Paenibacillus polysaccharolyticus TaxID=582692 RepID=UPI00203B29D6|nr:AVAST type 4 anti-phage nuclease Avs4 [Paenibacillus polysaccharolyticus]MCM3131621.1 ATP-binding protein [Paenibacillus polysaccharolyticus]
MITKPDWNIFKAKFSENPQSNFEWFCYLLFCVEFKLPLGIFRYKNQSGIETNPIIHEDEVIGWQAKFYETTLSSHKVDLIEMLKKSKGSYPDLTKIILFTNQEWGQGKLQSDSEVKLAVEEEAEKQDIQVEWRTASYFESPFVTIENNLITRYFFSLQKNIMDTITDMRRHTESLLLEIQTSIIFNEHIIELDRSELLQNLNADLEQNSILVLSGEGGVGKTAVIKKLYSDFGNSIPFYLMKANEFEVANVDLLFSNTSLKDFIDVHHNDSKKIFVIDSAEKLMDLNNHHPFKEFLSEILQAEWKVIFTARSRYLVDLDIHFIDHFQLRPSRIYVSKLNHEELGYLAGNYNFDPPNDYKLLELITNPFYLNEYLKFYTEGSNIGFLKFKELLWNRIIKKAKPSREQSFLQIAFKRANENQFFLTLDSNDINMDALVNEGVLGYEVAGYFITHDIYEEWALEKIIESEFTKKESNINFFEKIGDSFAIRRSFRNWMSEKLYLENDSVKEFIEEIIDDEQVIGFWKDEVMISVLLCDYSQYFFGSFKRLFLDKNKELLQRVSFLLRISCKEVDDSFPQMGSKNIDFLSIEYIFTKPKGNGWKSLIQFVYDNLDEIGLKNVGFILPILHDWNTKFRQGDTTRFSGLIALKYYQLIIQEKVCISRNEDFKDKILEIILYGAGELKEELANIFDEVLANKFKNYRAPYYDLNEMILTKTFVNIEVVKAFPEYVLKLGNLFWFRSSERDDRFQSDLGIEEDFGIDKRIDNYFPASAYQTPIYWLLKTEFTQTINFILDFTNRAVECFAKSGRNEVTIIELRIRDYNNEQFFCDRLWNVYRGTQVAPYVLESMHMALENVFLEMAKNIDTKVLEEWLFYLLENSKSCSITAIVVSIVLAYPEKTFNVAINLFKTKDLFFLDTRRMVLDQSAKFNYSIGYGLNYSSKLYQDERIETCNAKHRSKSLEHIALEYQFFRTEGIGEEEAEQRQNAIWDVLDSHYKELSEVLVEDECTKTWRLYLARMDRRRMSPTLEENDGNVIINFNPELEPEVRDYSETSIRQNSEKMKYTSLKLWAHYRIKNEDQYKKYISYEDDPKLALKEVREIIGEFERLSETEHYEYEEFFLMNHSIPAEASAVLFRDFRDVLTDEDRNFCKLIILEAATSSFREGYQYQISDGVESAISVLPILMQEFPNEKDVLKFILLMILFDQNSIGQYADFSDFSVNAIIKDLWDLSFEDAHSILVGYLFLVPKYNSVREKLLKESHKQNRYRRLSENEIIEILACDFENDIERITANKITLNELEAINELDLSYLITAFQLIPLGTDTPEHIQIAQDIISKFATEVKSDRREDRIDYSVKHDFLVKFSNLVLGSAETHIPLYLKPFIENFNSSKVFAELLDQFIIAEDTLNTKYNFWKVWDYFFGKVVGIAKKGEEYWYAGDIIKSYLFANAPWKETATEWRTFREEDKRFFKEICKELGHCPSTLYALSKLLNSIGINYLLPGVVWISEMLNRNEVLWNSELDKNTIFYLESIMKKYIYKQREDIRRGKKQKQEVLVILNFLVEKGSVVGYMLRERIL